MPPTAAQVLKTYITLTLLSTFAASLIWGINTLFLLDAGLSITEAFVANAFFTVGMVLFEIPTGIIADTFGRRMSYLLGAATLFASTLLYLWLWQLGAPLWVWALASIGLGLGYTFFSGATEAWLVDALAATKYEGSLEAAFAKGQIAEGAAMLVGAAAGGVLAQLTNLGVPYLVRAIVLGVTFVVTLRLMHDIGFTPRKTQSILTETRAILAASLRFAARNRLVRWLMLASPFSGGVAIYGFYAMQPYLLELYGRGDSYAIAGLAAAIFAGAQIAGGLLAPSVRRRFGRRTTALIVGTLLSAGALALIGLVPHFAWVLVLLTIWATVYAAVLPIRDALINALIPSAQRATVLSSDNLLASSGAAVAQPALGKIADVWGYPASYVVAAGVQLLAWPFLLLARREQAPADSVAPDNRSR